MPENTPSYQDRLASLRKEISNEGLQGYIIPRTDEFQSEFLAPYAQRLAFISGFTGSAGSAAVLSKKAVIMSDGRYTLQLREEVDTNLFQLEDSTKMTIGKWLAQHASVGAHIGYDVWLYTPTQIEKIQKESAEKGVILVACVHNLIDKIWFDQPPRSRNKITLFPDEIAGKTAAQKCDDITVKIREKGATACLLTLPDSICWLLNIRGNDIEYSPLCLSYVLLYDDATIDWFIDPWKVSREVALALGERVRVFGLDALKGRLTQIHSLIKENRNKDSGEIALCIDRSTAPIWFEKTVEKAGINVFKANDPCVLSKAVKTKTEQDAIRQSHIEDGVALTRFLKWIDENQNTAEKIDELRVEENLESFRRMGAHYKEPSFATIAGFADNGAIVHYRATQKTCKEIKGDGLLLVDSGGQYHWGTTDITRIMAIGTPSLEMQESYTLVLKGHIAVASAVFREDTTGAEIDALARKALLEAGLDYAHGTGHGVGCYLSVHESGISISPREKKAFLPGMLVSNEPGYYKEGEYGIRIENLVLVKEDETKSGYYCFETVSYAPLEPKLILKDMLNEAEKTWLNVYATCIKEKLSKHLTKEEKNWLESRASLF